MRDGVVAAGVPATGDFNRGDNTGVGYFEVTQRGGLGWNAARAFLGPVRDRIAVERHAHVERLIVEGGRVVGVHYREDNARHEARARAEVVLEAGAIGTPQILQLSGLGPADLLRAHGI